MGRFNKRKTWWFGNRKSISIETSGWKSHPSIYLQVDGDERCVVFHFGLGFGIWLTFENFLPKKWYPSYVSKHGNGVLGCEKEISFKIHGGSFWWCLWKDDDSSFRTSWRKGAFHFMDKIKGKHTYSKTEIERKQFILPFLEGNYNVEVIKSDRLDMWPRWPKSKMISFEVKAGYYNEEKVWVDKGVPVEGKGENSWDCDEDATYSISFPGHPYRKDIKSCYDSALYFWHSMMKSRERRGGAKWIPQQFKDRNLEVIK